MEKIGGLDDCQEAERRSLGRREILGWRVLLFQCVGRIDENLIYPNSKEIMRTWTTGQEERRPESEAEEEETKIRLASRVAAKLDQATVYCVCLLVWLVPQILR
jgi:hypothetical protein